MSNIKITTYNGDEYSIKGRLTFSVKKIEDEQYNTLIAINGQMTTHCFIEDILRIETHRYILKGIDVIKETFGSNDFNILYDFTAKNYEVKGGLSNLSNELRNELEEQEYKEDDSISWEV